MDRTATIHDATKCKHDSVPGDLFVVAIYEGRRIIDTYESATSAEGVEWARREYGLNAEVR